MVIEIISQSISTKVWDWAGIEHATHGFVSDCATWPGISLVLGDNCTLILYILVTIHCTLGKQ